VEQSLKPLLEIQEDNHTKEVEEKGYESAPETSNKNAIDTEVITIASERRKFEINKSVLDET
jgi:hypothetical protein